MTVPAVLDGRTAAAAPPRIGCTALSEVAGEPLAGTAPAIRRLVAVEHVGAWPRRVADHADPDVAELFGRLRRDDVTLLLIRRPGRAGRDCDGTRTVYVADLAPGGARVRSRTVRGTEDLASITFDPEAGEPVTDPVLLVCAHGRRDVCCAVRGRALATDLTAEDADVWECTHLGGHRFAPTALVLPTGYAYGRLDTGSALSALKAAAGGSVDPWSCRGHAGLEPAQQVAELAVREHTGIGDAGALRVDAPLRRSDPEGNGPEGNGPEGDEPAGNGPAGVDTVVVRSPEGRTWTVIVRADTGLPPRPPSCGAMLESAIPLVAGPPVEWHG